MVKGLGRGELCSVYVFTLRPMKEPPHVFAKLTEEFCENVRRCGRLGDCGKNVLWVLAVVSYSRSLLPSSVVFTGRVDVVFQRFTPTKQGVP